ncbi:pilus assembly protein HicB [Chitinophaga silvatica]|uniref:Pilus assembly protein HicB n=1 Tax=Chitinophaga silvatica TaxID=2282649 RepID=A0A3E1Y6P4_9BACT|nr:pilus assembly protein HicB [Chitinophaga silvatica]RFS20587.1 pilus assembly protein HicB [Chitinophaga silvatica]
MRKKKIVAIVEASSTGFGVFSENLPGITGYAHTIQKAKDDFIAAIIEVNGSNNYEIAYKYDIVSIFEHLSFLDVTETAKRIGINSSLLRQYKSGIVKPSEKQKERILSGLHELGKELINIQL